MKCAKCGHENPETNVVCEVCGQPLVDESVSSPITLTTEPDLTDLDEVIGNTPTAQAPEAKEEPVAEPEATEPTEEDEKESKFTMPKVNMPKIHISDETKKTILGALKESVTYFGYSVIHPGKTKYQVDGKSLGVIGLYSVIINWLFLYIVQRGLQQSFLSGFSAKVTSSFGLTFLYAVLMSLLFWVVGLLLGCVATLIQKEKISIKHALVDATHVTIIPMVLLLAATVISAFFFKVGFICYSVVFIAYLMNIMMLFKNAQNYISYLAVTVVISLALFAMYKMGCSLVMHWRIGTVVISDVVGKFNSEIFDLIISALMAGQQTGL